MKNKLLSLLGALYFLGFLPSTQAQEINFEGFIERDVMFDGLSYLEINVSEGPLKGEKVTAYFRTSMRDEFISENYSNLGRGFPVEMNLEGTEFKQIKVSGTLLKTNADFEDPQTGAIKSMPALRIKFLRQLEPLIPVDMPTISQDAYTENMNILNQWIGTYKNSQGDVLTITASDMDLGPNTYALFYSLKLVGRKGACHGYSVKNGAFVKEAHTFFDNETTSPIPDEKFGEAYGDTLQKTESGISFLPETHFGMDCLNGFVYEFKKIN
jgi:hypothetical protein